MCLTIEEKEFSFNNAKYAKVDGLTMGSPLDPVLANIFMGFYWKLLICKML